MQRLVTCRVVNGQQFCKVAQIYVSITVDITVIRGNTCRLAIVGQQLRKVAEVDLAVVVEVARACY